MSTWERDENYTDINAMLHTAAGLEKLVDTKRIHIRFISECVKTV